MFMTLSTQALVKKPKHLFLTLFNLNSYKYVNFQKCMGAMDCGVFAIATATSLLFKVPLHSPSP